MKFGISLHSPRHAFGQRAMACFAEGLRRHGIAPVPEGRVGEIATFWGYKDAIIGQQRDHGKQSLILEVGYIGTREEWISIGFNGLNGRAKHPKPRGTSRMEKHFPDILKPWRVDGEYALVLGQCRGDAAVRHTEFERWASAAYYAYPKAYFRPHPLDPNCALQLPRHPAEGLQEALAGAAVAVTFNSNSGVVAALEGVPVVATDEGSMVFDIATHDFGAITTPPREAWAENVMFAQWTYPEVESGLAWDHVKECLEDF